MTWNSRHATGIVSISRRRSFRFSLRTLFVAVTLASIGLGWLAWHLQWMRERREALGWLSAHDLKATIVNRQTPRPELPWSLKILGEQPVELFVIGANAEDKADLAAFRRRVAALEKLLPECYLINMDDD